MITTVHPLRSTATVTLREGDSINLTTGAVTRNSVATANGHLLPGLRRNDPQSLWLAVKNDTQVPTTAQAGCFAPLSTPGFRAS